MVEQWSSKSHTWVRFLLPLFLKKLEQQDLKKKIQENYNYSTKSIFTHPEKNGGFSFLYNKLYAKKTTVSSTTTFVLLKILVENSFFFNFEGYSRYGAHTVMNRVFVDRSVF